MYIAATVATSDADIFPNEFWRNTPDACASADAVIAAVDDAEFDSELWSDPDRALFVVGVDGIFEFVADIDAVEEFIAAWANCMDDGVAEDECNLKLS